MPNLIYNEQTKLIATALDRGSTACFSIGVLTPLVAVLLNLSGPNIPSFSQFYACVLIYGGLGFLLHAFAMRLLRGLRE